MRLQKEASSQGSIIHSNLWGRSIPTKSFLIRPLPYVLPCLGTYASVKVLWHTKYSRVRTHRQQLSRFLTFRSPGCYCCWSRIACHISCLLIVVGIVVLVILRYVYYVSTWSAQSVVGRWFSSIINLGRYLCDARGNPYFEMHGHWKKNHHVGIPRWIKMNSNVNI